MTETILTIVFLLTILCTCIYFKVRDYSYYNGFANKTMKKALNGELPLKDVREIHQSIAIDKQLKTKGNNLKV